MNRILALLVLTAPALAVAGDPSHLVIVSTPCARHTLTHCVVLDTRVGVFGAVADVRIECPNHSSVPPAPGWMPQEHPDGNVLYRVGRVDTNLGRFEACVMVDYANLTWGGWQEWECLTDPIPLTKACAR